MDISSKSANSAPGAGPGLSDKSPVLDVVALKKSYPLGNQQVDVLRGLSIDVGRGEMVAIMGPSGSGKTTLLNCIAGIDTPDDGTVRISGTTVDYGSEKARTEIRRRDVGMVFQFFNLVPTLTVAENVGLPFLIARTGASGSSNRERADQLLEKVGLSARSRHRPFQLSGGEMQLASIARALVHRPSLLLADEPTGNVNPAVGRSIMETLRSTAREEEAAILMVTHSPEHAAWADRVCFLKDGVIAGNLAAGDPDNVRPVHEKLLELGI